MLTRQKHSYSQLLQSETPLQLKPHLRSISDFFSLETTLKILGVFFWSIFTLTTGFVLGTSVGAPCTSELSNSRIHLPTISQTFHYNRTFAEIPSDTSNKAWESLFPPHGGFFDISGVSSQRSTLSIFHQLHCLDGIRHNYWNLYLAMHSNISYNENSMREMSSPSHIRHCIDLLRQSLMCSADTTLEVKEEHVNGVHGFGVLHKCSDWDVLLRTISVKQHQA
ncbi:hypothetical protein BCIN_15g03970 [Botrytis cinerea B05.10]|uniref:Oxidase ustYa n=1 Tax=Botryotinia fuckeliana (strain B05.10) TaxID=332648 RepID=A0A384K4Y1_BOTFB|nr:hypothetical protein BCIN_15g03970 [Botrytis cinerea B05.10]ATZ57876.1 hypothetical protein BCIN_15g03970 [Botrytis cinerea B05.10]